MVLAVFVLVALWQDELEGAAGLCMAQVLETGSVK